MKPNGWIIETFPVEPPPPKLSGCGKESFRPFSVEKQRPSFGGNGVLFPEHPHADSRDSPQC